MPASAVDQTENPSSSSSSFSSCSILILVFFMVSLETRFSRRLAYLGEEFVPLIEQSQFNRHGGWEVANRRFIHSETFSDLCCLHSMNELPPVSVPFSNTSKAFSCKLSDLWHLNIVENLSFCSAHFTYSKWSSYSICSNACFSVINSHAVIPSAKFIHLRELTEDSFFCEGNKDFLHREWMS